MSAIHRLAKLKAIMDRRSVLRALIHIYLPFMRRSLGMWHVLIDNEAVS